MQDAENLEKQRKIDEKERKKEEKLRKRREIQERRQKELEEYPEMKTKRFLEMEADQGSDNEENDHIVKEIDREKELEEEGGDENDQDLAELIENYVDVDSENEAIAYNKHFKDLMKEDQELIRRVIQGKFKNQKGRNNQFLEDHLGDVDDQKDRLRRIQQQIKKLEEKNEHSGASSGGEKENGEKEDEEEKQMRIRQLIYLKKKEMEKIQVDNNTGVNVISKEVLGWMKSQSKPLEFAKQKSNQQQNTLNMPQQQQKIKKIQSPPFSSLLTNTNSLQKQNSIQLQQKQSSTNTQKKNQRHNSFLQIKNNQSTFSQFTAGNEASITNNSNLYKTTEIIIEENSLSNKMFNSLLQKNEEPADKNQNKSSITSKKGQNSNKPQQNNKQGTNSNIQINFAGLKGLQKSENGGFSLLGCSLQNKTAGNTSNQFSSSLNKFFGKDSQKSGPQISKMITFGQKQKSKIK